jgi:hypothetical protein
MEPEVHIVITFTKHEFGVKVDVSNIHVKLAYQRPVINSRLRKLIRDYDPALVGQILLAREVDGSYTVIDGQHRVEMCKALGIPVIPAEVFEGVSDPDRGRLFLGRNDNSGVGSIHKYRSLATSGDEDTLNIDAACQSAGLVFIAEETYKSTFRDAAAARLIMKAGDRHNRLHPDLTGPEHLRRVLMLYVDTYGAGECPESLVLKGLSRILLTVRETAFDPQRLNRILAGIPPQHVVRNALTLMASVARNEDIAPATAMKRYLVDLYNRGLPEQSDKRLRY